MIKYTKVIIEGQEHILCHRENNTVFSFINIQSNDIIEREEYLVWISEGNTAEEHGLRRV
jgi:hypothetical protein